MSSPERPRSISTALTAAETGHLLPATLHPSDAAQTIDRILDVFPPHRQAEVKIQLSDCLQGVISQQLLPRCDAPGRVLAYEIMLGAPAIRNLIREHATEQIPTALQTGAQYGMCTMDACLKDLSDSAPDPAADRHQPDEASIRILPPGTFAPHTITARA